MTSARAYVVSVHTLSFHVPGSLLGSCLPKTGRALPFWGILSKCHTSLPPSISRIKLCTLGW